MYTIMTIVGTRPELIKLSRVIAELDTCSRHVLVHKGQNYDYELSRVFFEELGIREPDAFLDAVGETTAATIGNIISKADVVMERVRPDALLVYGDTNSCLVVIPAKRRRIPVFHMEAGNRCFDDRVPEEINRRIVDHTSDINMTLTEHARRYLHAEGIRPETVFKVGSSMMEVLEHHREKIDASTVLERMGLVSGRYFVVSFHREENVDTEANLRALVETLNTLCNRYRFPVIFSAHPRTMRRLKDSSAKLDDLVQVMKPLGFFDYVRLQKSAYCVLSDSGTLTEESSLLGFPAVMLRNAHERPEGMDEGTLVMAGLNAGTVGDAIVTVVTQHKDGYRSQIVPDYRVADVSKKVARIIQSYIPYVRATVWREKI